jgi:HAD superfamily hydrolase (TIGR01509 family)
VSTPAVVFDNDGLLLDTEILWTRAEEKLFIARRRRFTLEHKQALVGTSAAVAGALLEEMLDAPGAAAEIMAELHQLVMVEAGAGGKAMPGAVELVEALRAAGRPLALVSNSPAAFVAAVLGPSGLRDAFDVVLTPDDGLAPKPDPALYLEACVRLGTPPGACLALEDSGPGVAAARAAGLTVVGIPSLAGIELDGADLVASSLAAPEVWAALRLSR